MDESLDVSTPPLGNMPVMQSDIPPEMFLRPINFDMALKAKQSGIPETRNAHPGMKSVENHVTDDVSDEESLEEMSLNKSQMENTMDMLEQRQAMEQARLLQRFKELRQWQMQQQEILMKQQQMQLEILRKEQLSAQGLIVKQRESHWGRSTGNEGGKVKLADNTTRTPPRSMRHHPHRGQGHAKAQGQPIQTAQQRAGQLPAPVMYVPLNDDNDEIKTNPDLFSDTNSQAGSHATTEDGFVQLPDSASEVGIRTKLTFMDEDELDEGIGTQSIQSPGRGETKLRGPSSTKPRVPEVINDIGSDLEEQILEDENEEDDEISEEDDEDEDDDDTEDDEEDTRFMHDADDTNIDEKPVTGTTKTFEELLDEQLRAEEEKLRLHNEDGKFSDNTSKRSFLKKGQGIARFGLSDKPATLQSKENVKSTLPEGARASAVKHASNKGVKKKQEDSKSKQPQKTLSLKKSSPKKQQPSKISPRESVSKPSQNSKGKITKPSESSKSSQLSKEKTQKLDALNAKMLSKGNDREGHNQAKQAGKVSSSQQKPAGHPSAPRKEKAVKSGTPESIPDNESFVGRIKEREKNEELEKEDLEEFELLENFADNMSFCSNSSIVVKVLERDRNQKSAFTRKQPSEPAKVEKSPLQSPRTTVAKQLEATLKRGGQQSGQVSSQALNTSSVSTVTDPGNKISANKNPKDRDAVKDYIDKELGHKGKGRLSDVREDTKGEEKEVEDNKDDNEDDDDDDSEFELSESESDESSEFDSESENSRTLTSPSKVMTRKIASNRDRNSLNSAVTTERTGESVGINEKTALNTVNSLLKRLTEKQLGSQVVEKQQTVSSIPTQLSVDFSQSMKSPIVISKEGGEFRDFRKYEENVADHDDSFHLHGNFSSQDGMFGVGKQVSKSDDDAEMSDGSLSSYSDLKISKRQQKYEETENYRQTGKNYPTDSSQSESEDMKESDDDEDKFDDEEEWNDLTPKAKSPVKLSHHGDAEEGPPTSKLVSKLFPNLKPPQTKQQAENQQRLQSVTNTTTSDGVQSKLMREKLAQLDMEIEKFKNENLNLERLRKEREEGLAKLKKEIAAFEKEKSEELKRIQEYKNEETKKLKHEKKMFEKYQKAAREMPNKREREEIEMLKSQLTDLQDEMRRKESRWTSNNARLRSKLELLEQENTELKEEIKLMEMKRLEWLQKEQNTKKGVQRNIGAANTAYSQQIGKQFTSNSADFQTTDSDEETDPVRDESNRHSLQDTVNSNTMSLRPSPYENLVNVRVPAANSKTAPMQQKLPAPSGSNVSKAATSSKGHEKQNTLRMGQNKSSSMEKSVSGPSKSSKSSKSGPPSLLSVSTQLLHEDLPRGKPAIAAHQDTSMYSETETSMAELPRKTHQKLGISKSVINKGDKGYDEMTHPDGKVERIYSTGAREILFTNGTRKEISADGQYISVSFFNGDIKQIMPDQRVIYYYSETQATHTTYPDGLEILQFPNNQVEKHYPDGTKEITFPDQIIKYLFPSGSEESIFPDGTVIKVDRNGDKTIEFPNGQREIHNQDYKRREYPDGTVKTVYPDGKQETRYSNGRIRVKDKDGNIIVDKRC